MRPRLLLPVVVLLMLPPAAVAQTGGTAAPEPDDRAGGGVEYGAPVRKASKSRRNRERPLTASEFSAGPATLQPGGRLKLTYRIDGPGRRVRVRVDLVRAGDSSLAKRIRLGWKATRARHAHRVKLGEGELPAGDYVARLHASDGIGRTLRRTARASGKTALSITAPVAPLRVTDGAFPVRGPFSFGSEEARFGAKRSSHIHEGQDIMAAEGTPIVAPRAGRVRWKAYQEGGAGHYLVIRGDDGRDYVFMHLVSGSATVGKEDPVTAGQQIAAVGSTGRSQGAHLHFEIWPCGWYAKGCEPIDPRPELDAWAASAGVTPS